ncbi:cyanophycinase [Cupriavidus necator]
MRPLSGTRNKLSRWLFLLLAIALFSASLSRAQAAGKNDYEYFVTGSTADVSSQKPPHSPGLVLMGGGPDVDNAFKWMIQKSGGGNFLIIRATGTDAYNPYIFNMGGMASVATLIIKTRDGANDPVVIEKIRQAEAIFIAGGDQSDYINFWSGTDVQTELQRSADRNVPIGGTSAGLSVLGQFIFAALNGTLTSDEALANPLNKRITLVRDFLSLPGLGFVITDAHLDARDRMGRLVTFLARIVGDGWAGPQAARGIGVDVDTALVVDRGKASLVRNPGTSGSVYFLRSTSIPALPFSPKTPLTYTSVSVQRMSGAGTFDLGNWASYDGGVVSYSLSVTNGVLTSTQPGGAIY